MTASSRSFFSSLAFILPAPRYRRPDYTRTWSSALANSRAAFRLNRNGALDSWFDAVSSSQPGSTSLENALIYKSRQLRAFVRHEHGDQLRGLGVARIG